MPPDDPAHLLHDVRTRLARTEEELRASEAALREADRRKDEFLAMLGHELRNPLAPIVTALELMRLRGIDAAASREYAIINRQVKHLLRLVDDLLDVSRITRGKVGLTCAPVELGKIVANAYEAVAPLIEERSHNVELQVPARGMAIQADEMRFSQVVTNLLANAAKYTDRGGRICIEARRAEDRITLAVRDNGIGIDPETLPRVFDMFVQERQGSDRSRGGLGLGLTIVKSLVEAHGGTVRAESDGRHRGTAFIVNVPAA
ncbi:MAG TPA: HAMP domain-containing sensor histidine kinase [Kofleriaceae bacterium]|nr:HAMP domain-containing sensor histidine kinase [Kofleriaceae bacterium]